MDRDTLESLDRESLVERAIAAGVRRARILTRPELVDELLRQDPHADEVSLARSRGFFGRARDLLSKVVERGLHLPDALDRMRSGGPLPPSVPRAEPIAVPTVTLAEIYAAQGHKARALETVKKVLEREPEHAAAQVLLARLEDAGYVAPAPPLPPEPDPVDAPLAEGESEREATRADVPEHAPECVAIPLPRGGMHVAWQTSALFLPEGSRFCVRAVFVTPSWESGPIREVFDYEVAHDATELTLPSGPPLAVVRVAIGVISNGDFQPLSHSPAFEVAAQGGGRLISRTFRGALSVPVEDESFVARALRRAHVVAAAQTMSSG